MLRFFREKVSTNFYFASIEDAIRKGDLAKIKDHNKKYPGFTLEHRIKGLGTKETVPMITIAAACDNLQVLQFLLDEGADINAHDSYTFNTALYDAVTDSKVNAVEYLLRRGANIHAVFGISMAACKTGNLKLVELLHAHKVNFGEISNKRHGTSLISAISTGPHLDVVKFLLEKTLAKEQINTKDKRSQSALTVTCSRASSKKNRDDYLEIATLLIDNGATVSNELDEDGYSDLYYAVKSGSLRLVQLLLTHGAECSVVDKMGHSAGMIAANFGHDSLVDFLKAWNVEQLPTDSLGMNTLFYHDSSELVQGGNEDLLDEVYKIQHGVS